MEVIFVSIEEHKLSNRGFLIGPYCPIYGWGMLFITLILNNVSNLLLSFIITFLISGILEYSISYLLEKIFKLRWWDYSNKKYNINGRVCLETLIPFSILGTLAFKYINPLIYNNVDRIPLFFLIIIIIIFILDNFVTHIFIANINKRKRNHKKDSTNLVKKEISKQISKL